MEKLGTREEEIKLLKEDLKKVKLERAEDQKYVDTKEEKVRLLKDDIKKAKLESENDWKALCEQKTKELQNPPIFKDSSTTIINILIHPFLTTKHKEYMNITPHLTIGISTYGKSFRILL